MGTPASQQNTQLQRWNWDRLNLIVILFCSLGILVLGIILLHETLSAHLASFSDWEGFISALASIGGMIGTYGQWLFPSPNIKKEWQRVIEWFQENTLTNPTASSPARWNVPPKQHVIGRQQILREIKDAYNSASHTKVVIGGISGAGKSMVALKYAYDSNYKVVLWITASSIEEIQESCDVLESELTKPINKQVTTSGQTLPVVLRPTSSDPQVVVKVVMNWLKDNSDWLLVLDEYSDSAMLEDDKDRTTYSQILKDFLSLQVDANRHILVTTNLSRFNFTSTDFHYLPIRVMEDNDGDNAASLFLYYYYGHEQSDNDEDRKIAKEIAKELGYLPLALACSGMFCSTSHLLSRFLDDYRENPLPFFDYGLTSPVANKTMKANWQKTYDYVQKKHTNDAASLLKLCAFFAPELIPEELLCLAAHHAQLTEVINNQAIQQNTIEKLQKFSLLELSNNADNKRMFSIHTALQHAIRTGLYETGDMKNSVLCDIARAVVKAINSKLPKVNPELQEIDCSDWQIYFGYLPHAYACCRHILKLHDVVSLSEAVQLLYKTGCFLTLRAEFTGAEKLLNKALEIIQQQPSLDSKQPHLAAIRLALGKLSYAQGKFSDADTYYKEAMKASPESSEKAAILIQQGLLYDDLCDDDQAEKSYEEARKEIGTIYPLLDAILLNNEALLKMKPRQTQDQNRGTTQEDYDYKEAEDNLWKALSPLKESHPYILGFKANLVTLFLLQVQEKIFDKDFDFNQGIFSKNRTSQSGPEWLLRAEQIYTQAASIGEGTLGSDRPQNANHINNLAIFYYLQGKAKKVSNKLEEADEFFKMARDAYQRAEQIYNNICPMHPMHAIIERNYATLLKNNIDADNEHDLIEQLEQDAEKIEQDYRKNNSSLFKEQNNYKKNTGLIEQTSTQDKSTTLTEQQGKLQTTNN